MFELQPTEPVAIAGPTVELKTLTVSGRKLTKTIFNQLIREDICDEKTATLRPAIRSASTVSYVMTTLAPDGR